MLRFSAPRAYNLAPKSGCRISSFSSNITILSPVTPLARQRLISTRQPSQSARAQHVLFWNPFFPYKRPGRPWTFFMLAGLGWYGYSQLRKEIDELKSVVRAINVDGTGAKIKGYSPSDELWDDGEGKVEYWETRWKGLDRLRNGDERGS